MTNSLRDDLKAIWQAGVDGVDVRRLIDEHVVMNGDNLVIGEMTIPLAELDKISVIGAGKAAAGMAAAVERVLASRIDADMVAGFVNIPEGCEQPLRVVRQHVARPAGVNEPTESGVFGTKRMLDLVVAANDELTRRGKPLSRHLVFCLMSGGGSALMPLPAEGVTLAQKLAVTRFLSAAGATINEINTVRKQLSGIKGGRLKRFCRGTKLVGLILSDVPGDPLDVIASGPTVDNATTAPDAVRVLEKYGFLHSEPYRDISRETLDFLRNTAARECASSEPKYGGLGETALPFDSHICEIRSDGSLTCNFVIGNNATAVDAAGIEAEKRGYSHTMICATESEGDVESLAGFFADMARKMNDPDAFGRLSNCLISGGEPTVKLVPENRRGLGGRNQQLVLAVICRLFENTSWRVEVREDPNACPFAFLSGGTDGEDGPTNAAGAFFDGRILHDIANSDVNPFDYLNRNDAYRFFERFESLVKTGPTGTNVCDVRILLSGKHRH